MTAVQTAVAGSPNMSTERTGDFELAGSVAISPEMVEDFARATGDRNPIHFDDTVAQERGFDGAIAHAGLITGHVSRVMFEQFGDGTAVTGIGLTRVEKPVPVDSTISVYVREKRNRERGGTTFIKVDVEVRCENAVVLRMFDVNMVR